MESVSNEEVLMKMEKNLHVLRIRNKRLKFLGYIRKTKLFDNPTLAEQTEGKRDEAKQRVTSQGCLNG